MLQRCWLADRQTRSANEMLHIFSLSIWNTWGLETKGCCGTTITPSFTKMIISRTKENICASRQGCADTFDTSPYLVLIYCSKYELNHRQLILLKICSIVQKMILMKIECFHQMAAHFWNIFIKIIIFSTILHIFNKISCLWFSSYLKQ